MMVCFDDLPNELVTNILLRLPVKTLVSSTAVSKIWYSLIKNPSFISAHLSRSVSDPSRYYIFLLHNESPSVIVISDNPLLTRLSDFILPFETESTSQTLIGACNGLLCLTDYSPDCHDIYLINLFIHKCKKLDVESSFYADLIREINYETGYIRVGFGYCEAEDDYKVLRIINRFHHKSSTIVGIVKVEIYRLKSRKWKGVDASIDIEVDPLICPAFVHGCLYWIVNHLLLNTRSGCETDEYLLCFDLKDEVFSRIELPTAFFRQNPYTWDRCIFDKDGSVAILGHTHKVRDDNIPYLSICLLVLEKDLNVQFQWEELRYGCTDFNPVNTSMSELSGFSVTLLWVLGFSHFGRLILEGQFDTGNRMVAVDLDNSCSVEKLELVSEHMFDRAASVLESLVLFTESLN